MRFGLMIAGLVMAGTLSACVDVEPQDRESRLNLALLAIQENRLDDAQRRLEALLVDEPNNPYVRLALGVTMEEKGNVSAAAEHYRIARENGADAPIKSAVVRGSWREADTTVAAEAAQNLQLISN